MTLINGGQFLQTDLNAAQQDSIATLNITTPSFLDVYVFIQGIAMVENALQAKTLKSSHL